MTAEDYLQYSGKVYKTNIKKWGARLKKEGLTFSEDIYNSTIIKVFEYLSTHEIEDDKIEGFWYKAFLQNTKRDTKYSYHKKDDSIDVLKYLDEFPADDKPILLEDIKEGLKGITEIDFHILLMHYILHMTYTEIEELTNLKDIRYRVQKIIKKIKKRAA